LKEYLLNMKKCFDDEAAGGDGCLRTDSGYEGAEFWMMKIAEEFQIDLDQDSEEEDGGKTEETGDTGSDGLIGRGSGNPCGDDGGLDLQGGPTTTQLRATALESGEPSVLDSVHW